MYLFVYGTLRKDIPCGKNSLLLPYCEYRDLAFTRGELFEIAGYPGLVYSPVMPLVHGELYKIRFPNELFSLLDEYEECSKNHPKPHEYTKKIIPVTSQSGQDFNAWAYIYNRQTGDKLKISSANYFNYMIDNKLF